MNFTVSFTDTDGLRHEGGDGPCGLCFERSSRPLEVLKESPAADTPAFSFLPRALPVLPFHFVKSSKVAKVINVEKPTNFQNSRCVTYAISHEGIPTIFLDHFPFATKPL